MPNLEKSLQTSTRFLATTLHEIRTPIQTIIGSLELLNDTPLNHEQKEYIRQISFSAEALLSLANDILDYSKISNKDFKLEDTPFDLVTLVEKTTDLVSIEAFNKGLELVTDVDIKISENIMGDQVRVSQILLNIIKNAVKFTAKGYIYITVTIDDGYLLFKIIDTGIGVPKDKQKNLFEAYYQADASTTRKYGGTGLGLSICKSLVFAMNGKIGVTDNPEGGSIFYFKIPYRPAIDIDEKKYQLVVPANTKMLVVDDSALARKTFAKHLNKFGVNKISGASTADEALETLRLAAKNGEPFTAVFIDMLLPKVDGWHLATEINDDKEINNAKLYLMVPEGQMGGEAKMKLLNWFDGYLYKPVKRKKLFELVSQSFKESFETAVTEQKDPGIVLHERELAKKAKEANLPENIIQKKTESIIKEKKDSDLASGLHMLVAEDHIVNRRLLCAFLKKFGADILEAENGQEALDIVSMHPEIDFIFMDIQMPVMNGIDSTKEIRKSGYKGIIIACTANSDRDDFEHYTRAGMNDVLVKPFKSLLVKEMIEKWNTALILPTAQEIATLLEEGTQATNIWNEDDFMDTVGNDYVFGTQLIKDYINQTETLIKQIPALINSRNFEELRRIGHTLKGSSSTVSAFSLSDFGTRLNKAAKLENIDALKMNFNAIKENLIQFKNVINRWMSKNEL
ncbi:MAG: response regulator [Treponema sp.]|uniref:hybrid sensor histidine kinase/response regulator n=1 Tax=Treponema sp. TaxID=166 RepID=UPI00298E6806|nr:response regulator [Treponema sp.]MBR5934118.1 response regulator [Treponema sp.]